MDAARLSTQLHKHFAGLVAFSELSESELSQLARQLSNLCADEGAIRRALIASEVCRWRLAADNTIWDGKVSSSDFLSQHPESIVDTWQEEDALVSDVLVQEVMRAS